MKKDPRYGGPGKREGQSHFTRSRLDSHAVKGAIPPSDFYQYELPDMPPTRKGGWVDGGLCPFHSDTHKGSFRLNVDTGAFRCFACDAKGGDVIAFTMQREGLEFRDALAKLAEAWGVV
jgi:DNA primase